MKKILFALLMALTISLLLVSCGVQGEKGDKGETGAKGDTGEQGEKGETGKGVDRFEIVDGELIIYYTDGTSQNLGKIEGETEGTDGLEYYPLDDGTYVVSGGTTTFLEKIEIPKYYKGKAVTQIKNRAFQNAKNLKEITIPDSVTSIGDEAFQNCTGLTSIEIPSSVTSIGGAAFLYCSSLTNVTIPDSVTSIGYAAFDDCLSLTYNEYDNAYYLGNDDNPYVVLIKAKNTAITSCTINENTKVIYGGAFLDCTSLKSITIPDSVTSIGYGAFLGCTGLTSITIGDSVTSIGSDAFRGCTSLTIYCEATSEPSGWYSNWNSSSRPVYWYSEEEPTRSGNYWHYVDGVVTVWE